MVFRSALAFVVLGAGARVQADFVCPCKYTPNSDQQPVKMRDCRKSCKSWDAYMPRPVTWGILVLNISMATTLIIRIQIGQSSMSLLLVPKDTRLIH